MQGWGVRVAWVCDARVHATKFQKDDFVRFPGCHVKKYRALAKVLGVNLKTLRVRYLEGEAVGDEKSREKKHAVFVSRASPVAGGAAAAAKEAVAVVAPGNAQAASSKESAEPEAASRDPEKALAHDIFGAFASGSEEETPKNAEETTGDHAMEAAGAADEEEDEEEKEEEDKEGKADTEALPAEGDGGNTGEGNHARESLTISRTPVSG